MGRGRDLAPTLISADDKVFTLHSGTGAVCQKSGVDTEKKDQSWVCLH